MSSPHRACGQCLYHSSRARDKAALHPLPVDSFRPGVQGHLCLLFAHLVFLQASAWAQQHRQLLWRCVGVLVSVTKCQALLDCSGAGRYNCLTTPGLLKHKDWPVSLACCPSTTYKNPTGCFGQLSDALNCDHGGLVSVLLPDGSCSSLSYTYSTRSLISDSTLVLHHPPALPSALA